MEPISYWILTVNLFAFILFGIDKGLAKKKRRRIPERVLWTVSLLGGGSGAFLGMQIFRHKTKHLSFVIGIPACAVLNWVVTYFLYLCL